MRKIGQLAIIPALLIPWGVRAQAPAQSEPGVRVDTSGKVPVYRVTVVGRTTKAINYRHRSGPTEVDFRGTDLMPQAKGHATVNSKQGRIEIKARMEKLTAANQFGPEFLTYVLWAVTPEGRPKNLGEVLLNSDNSKIEVTTDLQTFGLIVTAEPYFDKSIRPARRSLVCRRLAGAHAANFMNRQRLNTSPRDRDGFRALCGALGFTTSGRTVAQRLTMEDAFYRLTMELLGKIVGPVEVMG